MAEVEGLSLSRSVSTDSSILLDHKTLEECLFGIGVTPFKMRVKKSAILEEREEEKLDQLQDLAPVSSKWSDCASSEDDDSCCGAADESSSGQNGHYHHTIDMKLLRKMVSAGGVVEDDESGMSHRALTWRILLGYLPENTEQWYDILVEKRKLYVQLVTGLFEDTADVTETAGQLRGVRHRRQQGGSQPSFRGFSAHRNGSKHVPPRIKEYWKEHKLDMNALERLTKGMNALKLEKFGEETTEGKENTENGTDDLAKEMKDFAESAVLLDEIRKDVVRTHPDLHFFLEPIHNLGRRRYAALERILFVWSKYTKGVSYVQGMNEIVGILYYVMANDQNEEWSTWAEADTYWLFHSLLVEMSDVFVAGLDDHDTGIQGRVREMQTLLARHDPEVREHLDEIGIETSFYAIRWWTTFLTREFLLPDTIRLWDSMFASTHKANFLRFVCVTMVMTIREELLKSDFSTCLKLLHSYPSTNIDDLLESSRALFIYESQITLACHRGGLTLHQALSSIESPPSVLMAFGFPNGTPPVSRTEQLERARATVETSVRIAAQGVFGKAMGLYKMYSKKEPDAETNQALALGRSRDSDEEDRATRTKKEVAVMESNDDIYMKAIQGSS